MSLLRSWCKADDRHSFHQRVAAALSFSWEVSYINATDKNIICLAEINVCRVSAKEYASE